MNHNISNEKILIVYRTIYSCYPTTNTTLTYDR